MAVFVLTKVEILFIFTEVTYSRQWISNVFCPSSFNFQCVVLEGGLRQSAFSWNGGSWESGARETASRGFSKGCAPAIPNVIGIPGTTVAAFALAATLKPAISLLALLRHEFNVFGICATLQGEKGSLDCSVTKFFTMAHLDILPIHFKGHIPLPFGWDTSSHKIGNALTIQKETRDSNADSCLKRCRRDYPPSCRGVFLCFSFSKDLDLVLTSFVTSEIMRSTSWIILPDL